MNGFRASFKHLIPILTTLIASNVLGILIIKSEVKIESLTLFPETPTGAALNSGLFIAIIVVMAFIIYGLIKYGFHSIVIYLIRITLIAAIFMLLLWYISIQSDNWIQFSGLERAIISGFFTCVLGYGIYRGGLILQIGSAATISSLIGAFLGFSIPIFTSFVLLVGLSIYDIVSVYKGPIGKIAERIDIGNFLGAVINYRDITIGMGDLVFYSMLINSTLLNLGYGSTLAASVGILGGSYGSLKILEKRDMFPGLPLPLISGIALALFFSIL